MPTPPPAVVRVNEGGVSVYAHAARSCATVTGTPAMAMVAERAPLVDEAATRVALPGPVRTLPPVGVSQVGSPEIAQEQASPVLMLATTFPPEILTGSE